MFTTPQALLTSGICIPALMLSIDMLGSFVCCHNTASSAQKQYLHPRIQDVKMSA